MALIGSFGALHLEGIEGYRIAACYTPGGTFNGNFYVYLLDRTQARTKFAAGASLNVDGTAITDTLSFKDASRTYSFQNIDLISVQSGASRNQRYRFLTFQYDTSYGRTQQLQASFNNTDPRNLADNELKKAYDIALPGGQQEHLLGFRMAVEVNAVNVYRYSTLRSGNNSMLAKLVEVCEQERSNLPFPKLTFDFSQGKLDVDGGNLAGILVHESFGYFNNVRIPSLSQVQTILNPQSPTTTGSHVAPLLKLSLEDYSSSELLAQNATREVDHYPDASIQAVTVVMQQGNAAVTTT